MSDPTVTIETVRRRSHSRDSDYADHGEDHFPVLPPWLIVVGLSIKLFLIHVVIFSPLAVESVDSRQVSTLMFTPSSSPSGLQSASEDIHPHLPPYLPLAPACGKPLSRHLNQATGSGVARREVALHNCRDLSESPGAPSLQEISSFAEAGQVVRPVNGIAHPRYLASTGTGQRPSNPMGSLSSSLFSASVAPLLPGIEAKEKELRRARLQAQGYILSEPFIPTSSGNRSKQSTNTAVSQPAPEPTERTQVKSNKTTNAQTTTQNEKKEMPAQQLWNERPFMAMAASAAQAALAAAAAVARGEMQANSPGGLLGATEPHDDQSNSEAPTKQATQASFGLSRPSTLATVNEKVEEVFHHVVDIFAGVARSHAGSAGSNKPMESSSASELRPSDRGRPRSFSSETDAEDEIKVMSDADALAHESKIREPDTGQGVAPHTRTPDGRVEQPAEVQTDSAFTYVNDDDGEELLQRAHNLAKGPAGGHSDTQIATREPSSRQDDEERDRGALSAEKTNNRHPAPQGRRRTTDTRRFGSRRGSGTEEYRSRLLLHEGPTERLATSRRVRRLHGLHKKRREMMPAGHVGTSKATQNTAFIDKPSRGNTGIHTLELRPLSYGEEEEPIHIVTPHVSSDGTPAELYSFSAQQSTTTEYSGDFPRDAKLAGIAAAGLDVERDDDNNGKSVDPGNTLESGQAFLDEKAVEVQPEREFYSVRSARERPRDAGGVAGNADARGHHKPYDGSFGRENERPDIESPGPLTAPFEEFMVAAGTTADGTAKPFDSELRQRNSAVTLGQGDHTEGHATGQSGRNVPSAQTEGRGNKRHGAVTTTSTGTDRLYPQFLVAEQEGAGNREEGYGGEDLDSEDDLLLTGTVESHSSKDARPSSAGDLLSGPENGGNGNPLQHTDLPEGGSQNEIAGAENNSRQQDGPLPSAEQPLMLGADREGSPATDAAVPGEGAQAAFLSEAPTLSENRNSVDGETVAKRLSEARQNPSPRSSDEGPSASPSAGTATAAAAAAATVFVERLRELDWEKIANESPAISKLAPIFNQVFGQSRSSQAWAPGAHQSRIDVGRTDDQPFLRPPVVSSGTIATPGQIPWETDLVGFDITGLSSGTKTPVEPFPSYHQTAARDNVSPPKQPSPAYVPQVPSPVEFIGPTSEPKDATLTGGKSVGDSLAPSRQARTPLSWASSAAGLAGRRIMQTASTLIRSM